MADRPSVSSARSPVIAEVPRSARTAVDQFRGVVEESIAHWGAICARFDGQRTPGQRTAIHASRYRTEHGCEEALQEVSAVERLISDRRMRPVWREMKGRTKDPKVWENRGKEFVSFLILSGRLWETQPLVTEKERDAANSDVGRDLEKLYDQLPNSRVEPHVKLKLLKLLVPAFEALEHGAQLGSENKWLPPHVREEDGKQLRPEALRTAYCRKLLWWMDQQFGDRLDTYVAVTVRVLTDVPTRKQFVERLAMFAPEPWIVAIDDRGRRTIAPRIARARKGRTKTKVSASAVKGRKPRCVEVAAPEWKGRSFDNSSRTPAGPHLPVGLAGLLVPDEVPPMAREFVANRLALPSNTVAGSSRRVEALVRIICDERMQSVWQALYASTSSAQIRDERSCGFLLSLEAADDRVEAEPVAPKADRDAANQDVRAAVKRLRLDLPRSCISYLIAEFEGPFQEVLASSRRKVGRDDELFPPHVRTTDGTLRRGARRSAFCTLVHGWMVTQFGVPRNKLVAATVWTWTGIKTEPRHVTRAIQSAAKRKKPTSAGIP